MCVCVCVCEPGRRSFQYSPRCDVMNGTCSRPFIITMASDTLLLFSSLTRPLTPEITMSPVHDRSYHHITCTRRLNYHVTHIRPLKLPCHVYTTPEITIKPYTTSEITMSRTHDTSNHHVTCTRHVKSPCHVYTTPQITMLCIHRT